MPLYVESDLFTQFSASDCRLEDAKLSCVSLDTAQVLKHPSIWYTSESFRYSNYCGQFGGNMLNADYSLLPFHRLPGLQDPHKIFIRPDSGDKPFIPHTHILNQHYHASLRVVSELYCIDPIEMCVVSSVKSIEKEWRLLIINDKVVTGSLYKLDGDVEFDAISDDVINFGTNILNTYSHRPDQRGFVLDVCLSNGEFKIVEFNSLSCADWYLSDTQQVIRVLESI